MKTQADRIAALLEKGKSITPLQALNQFGCFRLGARINDLRNAGYRIKTDKVKTNTGATIAKYKLIAAP
jgi:hypothetical protein